MPTKAAHIATAKQNQRLIDHFTDIDEDFSPWTAVVAFYKAVHVVETLFACDSNAPEKHTDGHTRRNDLLRRTKRYQNIWKHYRPLFQASMIARYLNADSNSDDVFSRYMSREKVKETLVDHHLKQVQKSVEKLLKEPRIF
ncbi:MAG: hypothetical protein N2C14_29385 [Planctomycetales bacterium]